MSSKQGRVTENEVAQAVVKYLSTLKPPIASIYQIKNALPNFLKLSDADREMSITRPNEEMWEQQVRNIISHREAPGNYVCDGALVYTPRRLSLPGAI